MWGDSNHIHDLKNAEQPWPNPGKPLTEKDLKAAKKRGGKEPAYDDSLDLKVAKQLRKAERNALKEQWEQDAKAAKRSQKERWRGDLADLKAAEWEAKAARSAEKERQRALRDTIHAEKAARKEQQRAEAESWRWTREEKAAWKATKKSGRHQTHSESSYALDMSQASAGLSCLGTMAAFALLAGLFLLVLLCFCGCY